LFTRLGSARNYIFRSIFYIFIIICTFFFINLSSVSAGLAHELALQSGRWGGGWTWLSSDGLTICSGTTCHSLYSTPEPIITPTATPHPNPAADERGSVPLKGQTKYVSCELRTTASNVEWYYTYRLANDPQKKLPEGFTDWESFFIARTGQNCNPNRGFRGDVNGKFVTACDPAAGGYGVYPRAIEAGLSEAGVPYRTVYLDITEASTAQLRDIFVDSYEQNQVLSLWVRQIVDAPLTWEVDPETGERYPIATHEHAVSGQVIHISDGGYLMRIIDPWPMYTGLQYEMSFDDIIVWMKNMGLYMLQVIG